jgi:RNA polymerase sigma-70 factor (ECF subfamily)
MSLPAPSSELPFGDWLERMRQHDPDAAAVLFDRYARAVLHRADRHLDRALSSKVDPEDVLQSVFRTVCHPLRLGEFDLIGWNSLWGLLAQVTLRKCLRWREHYGTEGRDAGRERPLAHAAERGDDPAEAVAVRDALEQAMAGLTPLDREIVRLRLEGHGQTEIAERVGRHQSKVSRVLSFVGERLERMNRE